MAWLIYGVGVIVGRLDGFVWCVRRSFRDLQALNSSYDLGNH